MLLISEQNKSHVIDAGEEQKLCSGCQKKNENPQKRFWIVKAVNSKSLKTEGAN